MNHDVCRLVEAALFASHEPLSLQQLMALQQEDESLESSTIRQAIATLKEQYASTALELRETASGYRFQVKPQYSPVLAQLWQKKPSRYSRATLETLAIIAYRQPVTRAEIEDIRGVSVNAQIIKTLMERGWVKIVGYKDRPGKPALLATTKVFLDYFSLRSLDELPPLVDVGLSDHVACDEHLNAADAQVQELVL